jgi:energy-coupling factor transport system ATP-binding protein
VALVLDSVGYTYAAGTGFSDRALAGVSLSVEVGEMVLVLGATGSGKSTLLRCAAGLLEPSEGSATIDGGPLGRSAPRGSVGLVFQDAEAQLFADTLIADVEFGPRNMGLSEADARARASEALTAVGLDPESFGERSPFGLSGGEARRAAVAGVLAMSPRYLLLDEPTASLDAPGRALVRSIVNSSRHSAGVVVVSHSAEEFLAHADRVLMLAGGRTSYYGSASGLLSDSSAFDVAGLVAPEVLRVQQLAVERGLSLGEFTLDPREAARNLASAGGWA